MESIQITEKSTPSTCTNDKSLLRNTMSIETSLSCLQLPILQHCKTQWNAKTISLSGFQTEHKNKKGTTFSFFRFKDLYILEAWTSTFPHFN